MNTSDAPHEQPLQQTIASLGYDKNLNPPILSEEPILTAYRWMKNAPDVPYCIITDETGKLVGYLTEGPILDDLPPHNSKQDPQEIKQRNEALSAPIYTKLTSSPLVLSETDTIEYALRNFLAIRRLGNRDYRIRSFPIVNNKKDVKPLGFLGYWQLLAKILRKYPDLLNGKSCEAAVGKNNDDYSILDSRTLQDAKDKIDDYGYCGLVVKDSTGQLKGVLSSEVIRHYIHPDKHYEHYASMPLGELIKVLNQPDTILRKPQESLYQVAKQTFGDRHSPVLPLTDDNGNVKGILTYLDVVRECLDTLQNSRGPQKSQIDPPLNRDGKVRIVVSYAHGKLPIVEEAMSYIDDALKDETIWWDKQLEVGTKWDEKIRHEFYGADIAICFVDQSFLRSAFIQNVELEILQKNNSIIVPIILEPCNWQDREWLRETQWFPGTHDTKHTPDTDNTTIADLSTPDRQKAWVRIGRLLKNKVEGIKSGKHE